MNFMNYADDPRMFKFAAGQSAMRRLAVSALSRIVISVSLTAQRERLVNAPFFFIMKAFVYLLFII
jgi:hypothetical protein